MVSLDKEAGRPSRSVVVACRTSIPCQVACKMCVGMLLAQVVLTFTC
jgi:hypothetical protein